MRRFLALLLLTSLFLGCGGKPSVAPPKFNANASADKAMELFDSDGDGILNESELEASPGLKAGLGTIDDDGDGKISREEIKSRVDKFVESKTGALPVEFRFSKGGKPIVDAEVVFDPEPFLEGVIEPATGKTDGRGMGTLRCSAVPIGVQQGFYRVRITDGKLPAKYNTETELGADVSGNSQANQIGIYEFKL